MNLSLIVAYGRNKEIGLGNQMLWHIPEDFKHFKTTTMGHFMIMGRKTYESIGRPLPGRTTIILSQNPDYQAPHHVEVCPDLSSAIEFCKKQGAQKIFICGGGQIYKQAIELVDEMYISEVDFSGEADTFFPEVKLGDWELTEQTHYEASKQGPKWTKKHYRRVQ